MAHIHTELGEHDHTASAFIVRTDTPDLRLLLHRHKKLGVLLQPGGHVELDENPWQAIRHEIVEETGYDLGQLKILQPRIRIKHLNDTILHPVPVCINTHNFDPEGAHKHTDEGYAFITDGVPRNRVGEGESTDIQWVSLTELRQLKEGDIFANVREIGEFVLNTVAHEWEPVELNEFQS